MKILGITAEYNPFHNGHKYHIDESRKLSGADCVVAVMSGNFTQRGEAAVLDKWQRSRLAIKNGVDLVIELPFIFACNRAEIFACGAIDLLKEIGVEWVSFGSENGDVKQLKKAALQIVDNEKNIELSRREFMKNGASFAKAGLISVEEILGKETADLMRTPNNILAIEYIKRMLFWEKQGIVMRPMTVKRHGSGYFESNAGAGFAGATAIRQMDECEYSNYMPEEVAEVLVSERNVGIEDRLFEMIRYQLTRMNPEEVAGIYCMGEGLENKLKKEVVRAKDIDELISSVVSKRYTASAVRRVLVYLLLGIDEYSPRESLYCRVLATNEQGRRALSMMKKRDDHIPIITNVNKVAIDDEDVQACLHYDMLATDIYNLLCGRSLYSFSDKVKKPYVQKNPEV